MARLLTRHLRFWVRSFWGAVLFAVIALAVVVQLGRALFPVLDDYRVVAEEQLSAKLGMRVQIGGVHAEWKGLRPRLTLTDVAVHNAGESVFAIARVHAEISLLSSLRDWRLAFRRLGFSGLAATLEQNPEGQWWIRGLDRAPPPEASQAADAPTDPQTAEPQAEPQPPPKPQRTAALQDPLDIFLFGRRLELSDTRLDFIFRGGQVTRLEIPQIRLENDADFHRLTARFSLDRDRQSLDLVVEGLGDPRNHATFDAKGYLRLQQFPAEKVLAALGLAGDRPPPRDSGRVNLDLWFQGTSSRGLKWHGALDLRGLPLPPPPGVHWPESVGAKLAGTWLPREGWQLQVADMQLRWPGVAAPPLDLHLRGHWSGDTRLAVDAIDLGQWSRLLMDGQVLQGEALQALQSLRPEGRLYNLDVLRLPADQGYFNLRAQIEQGGVQAWFGAPALQGINGLIEANARGGQVHLHTATGFSMHFPRIYHQPLVFREAQGTVRWTLDLPGNWIGVSSNTVRLANEEVEAKGHFNLRLPLRSDPQQEPEMTLVVGAEKGSALLHRMLVPYTVPQTLYEWLGRAIGAGELHNVGFIYHGSLLKEPRLVGRAIQLHAQVTEAQVTFDPEWPPLRGASGLIYQDDESVRVNQLAGQLDEVEVAAGEVTLVQPAPGERALRVRGEVSSDGRQARQLLDRSPLRDLGGDEVASWRWQGGLRAVMDLQIPLSDGAQPAQLVDLQLDDVRLTMPDLELEFEGIRGPVRYDSARGLSSPGIAARLWGQPVQMTMSSHDEAGQQLMVGSFQGVVDMVPLRTWSGRPELQFAHGSAPVSGEIRVPLGGTAPVRLAMHSSLEGVRVEVPGLLGKPADQPRALSLAVEIGEIAGAPQQSYLFDLPGLGQMLVLNRGGELVSVDLAAGTTAQAASAGQFRIHGRVAHLDALTWGTLLARLGQEPPVADTGTAGATEEAEPPMEVNLDLRVDRLQVRDLVLEDFGLRGSGRGGEWRLTLDQSGVAGTVQHRAGQPLQVDLERLFLPGAPAAPAPPPVAVAPVPPVVEPPPPQDTVPPPPDFWDQLEFASVPPVDFQVRDLRRGDRPLGSWSAKIRPTANGLLTYDLKAEAFGLKVAGADRPGAELVWLRTPHGHTSYFAGVVEAQDLAESFRQLGLAPVLSSEQARFILDLQWPAPPARLTLAQAVGVVNLLVERGAFVRSGNVGENPLVKLIGLLNFDTLARRLRLDFSDLTASGLSYETIQASLLFDSGVIHIQEPLQVATPSSHLQLVGDLDAVNQTLDAQLVATLPLAGNLTVAAALTGGVSLAVGVYLAGKLFKNQVARVSSLRYDVEGTWDNPEMSLDRVFESRVPTAAGGNDDTR